MNADFVLERLRECGMAREFAALFLGGAPGAQAVTECSNAGGAEK
jgi:hypothetical protein